MVKIGKIVFFIFSLCLLLSSPVFARDYKVSVKQTNTDGWTYAAVCKGSGDVCHLFMGITPENGAYDVDDLELDIGLFFRDDRAYFQVKAGNEYLIFANGNDLFSIDTDREQRETVQVFARNPMAENDPPSSLYQRLVVRPPPKLVAALDVTIEPIK